LGLALKKYGVARIIIGTSRTAATMQKALEMGAIDQAESEMEGAVAGCDLVVICTPVGLIPQVAARIAPALSNGALLTDVGSTKRRIVEALESLAGDFHFVGGHPLAGSEKTGVAHARADLFVDRTYFLTATPRSHEPALTRLRQIVEAIGARPVVLRPEQHDRLLACTSHLPHLLACLSVALLRQEGLSREQLKQTVGQGFRDVTRVAAGSGEVWADVLLSNADYLAILLDRLSQALQGARCWLDRQTRTELLQWLDEVAEFRRLLGEDQSG